MNSKHRVLSIIACVALLVCAWRRNGGSCRRAKSGAAAQRSGARRRPTQPRPRPAHRRAVPRSGAAVRRRLTRRPPTFKTLDQEVQGLKKDVIDLNKDLFVLEEELLFPANTQVAVYVSMDVGSFFALDSVTVKIDNKEVKNYLYTAREARRAAQGRRAADLSRQCQSRQA